MVELSRRGVFGAAASVAAAAVATPPSAEAAVGASGFPELSLRARAISPADRLQGVVGYVLKRADGDEKPNCWAAYGEKLDNGGIIYDTEYLARYVAERDWPCVKAIQYEAGELRKKLKAKRIPFADSDDDMIMVSDDRVYDRDDALDRLQDDERCWVFGTEEHAFNFDIEEALDNHLEDSFEEASEHVVDREGLRAFWSAWSAKQSLTTYYEDSDRILVIDAAAFEQQVAEWQARLDLIEGALARIEIEGAPATHLFFVCTLVSDLGRHLKRNWNNFPYVRRLRAERPSMSPTVTRPAHPPHEEKST